MDNFWLLPYDYVLSAIKHLVKLRTRELHEGERPTAVLALQQAEMNRDKNKRRRPFELEDFYLYNLNEDKDRIDPIYGAAAKALIERGSFPFWALFAYKELSERAEESIPPQLLCYQCDSAILLAPQFNEGTCKGMLIALESASLAILEMESPCGKKIRARMPEVNSKVIAKENCYLDVIS